MKTLLIRPPDNSLGEFKKIGGVQHPMSLLYLATYARKIGYDVDILDLEVADEQDIVSCIQDYDIIGIGMMSPHVSFAKRILRLARSQGLITVLGGPHPTVMPEHSLNVLGADIIVRGEGEITFSEILAALSNDEKIDKIHGVSFKSGGKIIHNPNRSFIKDLDQIPIPDRTLINMDEYIGETTPGIPKRSAVMFTSRGCPYLCNFCSANLIQGRRYRFRSVDNILQEVRSLRSHGFEHITIDDDSFTINKERVLRFCNAVAKNFPELTFDCDSRVDAVDEKMLTAMKNAGFLKIAYGIESGSPKVLKDIKKNISVKQIRNAFRLTKNAGIATQAFISIGHITETNTDIRLTRDLVRDIRPDYLHISVINPYPGTELFEYANMNKTLDKLEWEDLGFFKNNVLWKTKHFTGKQLISIRNRMYRDFYMNPKYIFNRITKINNLSEFIYNVKSFFALRKQFRNNW